MILYNSLSRTREEFVPNEPGKVKVYTCGPTVYHFAHIGNLRTYIMEDVLDRYLRFSGYDVKRVMNITDVGHLTSDADTGEDKMLKGAKREHKTVMEIAKYYTDCFFEDCKKLNIRTPDVVQPATGCIADFIKVISALLEKGYAYEAGGNIYFDTSKLKQYYVFHNFEEEDLAVGVREGVEEDGNKRNKADFVLWFTKSKFEDQALKWDSPWGVGYPGWHIECSVMSKKYLGDEIDIHAGGEDLIFPHHENEIAQSEGCTGCKFVNYWLHNGFITINSEKMSKSLNNFFLAKDVLKEYSGDALRYFLLSVQYRNPLDYSRDRLDEAEKNMERLSGVIRRLKELAAKEGAEKTDASRSLEKAAEESLKAFHEAMDDDFNTGLATGAMFDLAKAINIYGTAVDGGLSVDHEAVEKAYTALKTIMDILGILEEVWEKTDSPDDKSYNDLMDIILAVRQTARKEKMYKIADEIRDRLDAAGIVIEDTPTGARWKRRGV